MDNHCVVPIRNPRIEIVYRPIDQLKPNPRNARRHSRKQVQQIADSIEAFDFNVPTGSGAGHGDLLPRGSMAPPGRQTARDPVSRGALRCPRQRPAP